MNKMDLTREKPSGFTIRAFITGIFFCALVAIMAQYSSNIVLGSYLAIDHMPAGAISIFFIFTLFINPIFRKMGIGFSSSEQLLIYIMLLLASSVVTMGLGSLILPIMAGSFYYATPENKWAELIQPHIKSWLVPQGEKNINFFFEGLPKGGLIPWTAWIRPLCAWLPFIFTLYLVMISIMVILRKQWVEREKLIFPLTRLPVEIVKEDKGNKGSLISPFYRNKLMWLGFAIPFIIGSINAFHYYFHFIPQISLYNYIRIMRETTTIVFRFSFPVIGFVYLVNRDVAFSFWFFCLFSTLLQGYFNMMGIGSTETTSVFGAGPIFSHLGMGSFLTLVIFGLWMARGHLRDVFRKAFKGDKEVDDSEEILSYRTAVICIILGIIFMTVWLTLTGIPFLITILFLFIALILFLGLTRIISESGIPAMRLPEVPSSAVISAIGSSHIGAEGVVGLSLTAPYSSDVRTLVMCSAAHGLKMGEEIGKRKRLLFWAMSLAIFVGISTSLWTVLRLAYLDGGMNLNTYYFRDTSRYAFDYSADKVLHPAGPNGIGWLCKGIGAGVMFLLMFMRNRFLWWPLHPLGFTIGPVWLIRQMWFSVFLAWLFKTLILRLGGPKIYQRSIPFFLGLILGQYSCAGVWFIIDLFTKMTGNQVFWI